MSLARIFFMAPDILAPLDFIGATFTADTDVGEIRFTIHDVRDSGNGRCIAILEIASGRRYPQPFPDHRFFANAHWEDAIEKRIAAAVAAIEKRDRALAERAVDRRIQRERDEALDILKQLVPIIAIVPDGEIQGPSGADWRDIILALDALFDDIQAHDDRSAAFIADIIKRTRQWGPDTFISEKQQAWVRDVAKRTVAMSAAVAQ